MTASVATSTHASNGNAFAGTGTLVRFALRRDRLRIPVWVGSLTLLTVYALVAFDELYTSAAKRAEMGQTMATPAGLAMTGPKDYLSDYNLGSMMSHQMLGFTGVMVGIMSVLLFVRHTRAEEETGRAELVRAGVVGRHAQLAAAVTVVVGANVLFGLLLAVGMGGLGIDGVTWEGSLLYGAAHAAMGLVFTGVAAVAVQVSQHHRGASGLAFAVVGVAYVLRAAGDVGENWLVWLSPIGWAQQTMAYVDNLWWPLLPALVAGVVLIASAAELSTRRDVGSGLRSPRAGAANASALLTTPLGFALRLHRGLLIGFTVGLFLLGAMYGSILDQVEKMIDSFPPEMREGLERAGGASMTESFVSTVIVVLAIAASIYVVIAVGKLRSEENDGRAEPVLATALSRAHWAGSHLTIAMAGGALTLLAAALGIGVAGAAVLGDGGFVTTMLGAGLVYVPAIWVVGGVAALLYGWLPRASVLAWVLVAYAFVVGYLGELLQFPEWMNNISPFGHVPQLPAAEFDLPPVAALLLVAAALVLAGLIGFRRRNVESR